MLKRFAYIFLCLTLAACTDHSYRGLADADIFGTGAYPVLLSVGPSNEITTRGTGAVDMDEGWLWNGAPIYVYAFRQGASFASLSHNDRRSCLLDGSMDDSGTRTGKKARVTDEDAFVSWESNGNNVYYFPKTDPYDFYAYYIDDLTIRESDITRSEDAVMMKVTIDGSRDLMTAKAELTEEQLGREGFTDEDRRDIRKFAFSAYTANRNIHPVIYFNHHLARLRFDIYAGQSEAADVCVQKITVRSKDEGVFTVAHKDSGLMGLDFSADASYTDLALAEKDGTPLLTGHYRPSWKGGETGKPYEQDAIRVGGSLLAAPASTYSVTVHTTWKTENGREENTANTFEINSTEGAFVAGKQYSVRLALYGPSEIRPSVQIQPWGYGGNITVDEENIL